MHAVESPEAEIDMAKTLKNARDEGQIEGMIFILDIINNILDGKGDVGGIHPIPDSRFRRARNKIRALQGKDPR